LRAAHVVRHSCIPARCPSWRLTRRALASKASLPFIQRAMLQPFADGARAPPQGANRCCAPLADHSARQHAHALRDLRPLTSGTAHTSYAHAWPQPGGPTVCAQPIHSRGRHVPLPQLISTASRRSPLCCMLRRG